MQRPGCLGERRQAQAQILHRRVEEELGPVSTALKVRVLLSINALSLFLNGPCRPSELRRS